MNMTLCNILVFRCKRNFNLTSVHIFKRFKSRKEKFALKAATKTNAELALSHYDLHLGNIYTEKWPSMRLALLSQPKYCAVMNNFCEDHDSFLYQLAERGGFDFVSRFKAPESHTGKYSLLFSSEKLNAQNAEQETKTDLKRDPDPSEVNRLIPGDAPMTSSASDLMTFVPGQRVLSGRESLMQEENLLHHGSPAILNPSIGPNDVDEEAESVSITASDTFQYPHKLKAVLHTKGDLADFQPAKRDHATGKLSYYLMDAGSVLPVLCLDLFPGCQVLDMCAAPGGKSFCMLQTMLPGSLVCLDRSYSRMLRLRNSLRIFFPQSYTHNNNKNSDSSDSRVQVKHTDACVYAHNHPQEFDRVLVDVPCYADRHTLVDVDNEDSTLFKSSRQQDRIHMQALQQRLLVSALKAVRIGGVVVYSTCTLFPSQNDVVVRLAIESAHEELGVEAEVVDTGRLAEAYEDFFCFQEPWEGKMGQLVVPNITANFGPTYLCKIRRIQ